MNMDNEPRMQDRSPEGQMFAIESEIKNMMKDYEVAVRSGDNQRAQMIADAIDRMQKKKIELQGGIADMAIRQQMAKGGESSFPDLTGDGQVTQADILKGRGVYAGGGSVGGISPEDNQMIQRAFSTQSGFDVGQTAQMLKDILVKKYPNIPEPQINAILSKGIEDYSSRPPVPNMAEGGEADMQMSEQQAMSELEGIAPEAKMIEQLVMAVMQMIQQGVSEADVRAFLTEQGLDDEDIEDLFMIVMQQIEQGPTEEPIGQELQGMM
jgi:hypothetical protein